MKYTFDFNPEMSEFYLLPSVVLYKNSNEDVKWFDIRANIFKVELNWTIYYGRKKWI